MAQQLISIGTSPNDNSGDPLRTAFIKTNSNFTELYAKAGASNLALINNQLTSQNYNGNIDIVANGSGYITTDNNSQVLVYNTANSTSTTSGAVVINGGVGIAGSLYVGGIFSAPSASFASLDATPIGANVPSTGTFTTINSVNGTINNFNTYTVNATSGGFQSITANVILGNYAEFTSITYTAINNTPVGNSTPSTGAFTWGNIGNLVTANAKITGGSISGVSLSGLTGINNIPIGATTPNSGIFTNLQVTTGNIRAYFNGAIGANTANTGAFTTISTTGNANINSNSWLIANNISTTAGSGANLYIDPDGVADVVFSPYTEVYIQSNLASSAYNNGALVVSGGVGVNGNVYASGVVSGNGFYSATTVGSINNPDGIVIDYATGMGRISVGSADGLSIYNGGVGSNQIWSVSSVGAVAANTFTSQNGGQITGYLTGAIGANTPNSATFTEVTISGNLVASNFTITGNITGSAASASTATTAGTATYASTSGLATNAVNVTGANQANITSVGTLANLLVSGNVTTSGNVNVSQDVIMDGNIIARGMTAGKNYTTSNGISSGSYVNLTKTHIINNNSTTATIYGNLYNQLDGQIVTVSTKSAITNLYLIPNAGITINGNVTTLAAGGYCTYQYIGDLQSWFRIG